MGYYIIVTSYSSSDRFKHLGHVLVPTTHETHVHGFELTHDGIEGLRSADAAAAPRHDGGASF